MSRGIWKIINSWWILLTFTLFFNWIAFFYIGITAKHRRWIYYGIIYSIPFILVCIFIDAPEGLLDDLIWSSFFILWIISIGHAFMLRKEYLIRREYVQSIGKDNEEELRRKIEQELNIKSQRSPNVSKSSPEILNSPKTRKNLQENVSTTESKLVDINNDSEQSISELPGVGIILAKKAIELRETRDFESVDDFGQSLGLKPHIIEQIRPFVIINPNETLKPKQSGRLVDF